MRVFGELLSKNFLNETELPLKINIYLIIAQKKVTQSFTIYEYIGGG
jgi:hypothetical protein